MPNKIYLINENITRAILCETCANIVFEKIPHKTIEEENSKKQVYLNNKSIIHQVVVGYTNGWKNVKQYHYIKKEYAVKINEKKNNSFTF